MIIFLCVIFVCCIGWLAFLKFFLKTQSRTNQVYLRQNAPIQLETNLSHVYPPQYPGHAGTTDTYNIYNLNGDFSNNMNTLPNSQNAEKTDDLPSYLEAVQKKSHQ